MNTHPIIIGGFYRSGTSLVRRLLDAHSMVHCPSEIKLWRNINQEFANDPYSHARIFKTIKVLSLTKNQIELRFAEAYMQLREDALKLLGKKIWADKDPENALYLSQWQNVIGETFRYVHVFRHPIDTLASAIEANFKKTLPDSPEGILRRWQDNCFAVKAFESQFPARCYVLSYEKLVNNPEVVLSNLFTWLDLPFEGDVLKNFTLEERGFGVEDPKIHQHKTIHAKSVGRRFSSFTEEQINIFETQINECSSWFRKFL